MFNDIISVENLLEAWREFLSGKRHRRDVSEFAVGLIGNILGLHHDLANRTYSHGGYRAFRINDPKPRDIHKASVRDRLLHHAVYRVLYPHFDRQFIYDSFSCRLGKGTHRGMDRFRDYARQVSRNNTRTAWVLKCDVRKFFASVDHGVMMGILRRRLPDRDTVWLLGRIIRSFHTPGRPGAGLPLGNLTSQLLVNIYMNELDQFIKRGLSVRHYIRYADDFVVLNADRERLRALLPVLSGFLRRRLRLVLHPDKVFIRTLASGVDFLGWVHFPTHRVLRPATRRRMVRRLKENLRDSAAVRASYRGTLRHGNAHRLERDILGQGPLASQPDF